MYEPMRCDVELKGVEPTPARLQLL